MKKTLIALFVELESGNNSVDDKTLDLRKTLPESDEVVAGEEDAEDIFEIFLKRREGKERAGRSFYSIALELLSSMEYRRNNLGRLFHFDAHVASRGGEIFNNGRVKIVRQWRPCILRHGNSVVKLKDNIAIVYVTEDVSEEFLQLTLFPFIPVLDSLLNTYGKQLIDASFIFGFDDINYRDDGIYYCSNKSSDVLVPDYEFLRTKGYQDRRRTPELNWDQKIGKCYWRGSDYGVSFYIDPKNNQRVRVATMSNMRPDLLDAKITADRAFGCEGLNGFYRASLILSEPAPQSAMEKYKYLLVIDGVSNTWPGTFSAMLSGGCPIIVQSPECFKQWFHHLLTPWVNFVPVKHDLSDLIEVIEYLSRNDLLASRIAGRAEELALSITYEKAIDYAVDAIYYFLTKDGKGMTC